VADPAQDELARLRAEIDRIDDDVVALLLERIGVVHRIGAVKTAAGGQQGGIALRPAREAEIIRRLAAAAGSALPAAALTRMWRELLAATTRLQTPLRVAFLADPTTPEVKELARDHFGTLTPLVPVESAQHGFRMIGAGDADLLVLPAPRDDRYWWSRVALTLVDSPLRIVSRLPFCAPPDDGSGASTGALVLGKLPEEPSSADVTMVALEVDLDLSRARLTDLLAAGGVEVVSLAALLDLMPDSGFYMLEAEGTEAIVLAALQRGLGPVRDRVLRLEVLGSYPRPLTSQA
jgi:chorismate mutase